MSVFQQGLNTHSDIEEKRIRAELDMLHIAYRDGHINVTEYYRRTDDLNARLYDLQRVAQHQQMQRAYQQQQLFAQQAMAQGMSSALAQSGAAALFAAGGMGGTVRSPKPLETSDVFGEVVAWRCWRSPVMPILTSCHMTHIIWMPKQIEEAKGVGDYNQLGFHAWADERQATGYALTLPLPLVIGRVKLWGDVVHHERGYRAQFAKIVSLDTLVLHHSPQIQGSRETRLSLKTLQRRFGVGGV